MAVRSKTVEHMYKNRCKYLRSSMVPSFEASGITTISGYLEHEVLSTIIQNAQKRCYIMSSRSELYKNVETQTDYRESETQTEPWEPPYRIVPGHNPEILTLARLTWEHGLPASVREVHIINRIRMRKAWETILPPMDTPANMRLRNSIITALEIDNWTFRESEIQTIMDLRLKLMKDLLKSRESANKKEVQNRFGRLRNTLEKRRDERVRSIRHNLERDLRKLHRKQRDKRCPGKLDIIELYSDPKSDLYASQMRFGEYPRRQHEKLQKRLLSKDYVAQEVEEDTTLSWLTAIEDPKVIKRKSSRAVNICLRETRWTEEKLRQLHSDLKAIRLNLKSVDAIPRLMKRNYKRAALPVTPRRAEIWDSKQKKKEDSATFIQKIVRGRAMQCLMYERRDRCRELIEELQSTRALDRTSEQERYNERMHILELQRLQNDKLMQENRLYEILDSLEGKTICGTLDFLSKELVRLEDERKAHAFALLAERERRMREASEAGRRQSERNRRREFDEMFKQIVKVNQESVEAYLEDVIKEGVNWISEKTAKEHVLELCDNMADISKYVTENANDLADEELTANMIYNFVLPEVEKRNMRTKIRDQQQNYTQIIHKSLYEKILDLPSIELSRVTDHEVCIKNKDMQISCKENTEQDVGAEEAESLTCYPNIEDKTKI